MADFQPDLIHEPSPEAQALMEGFRTYIAELRARKHAQGRSYSVLDGKGNVAHAHPDGTIRKTRDPHSEIVG